MNNNNSQLLNEDGFINLTEIIISIKKSKILIASVTFFFMLFASFYSSLQTNEYLTELKVDLGETLLTELSNDSNSADLKKIKNSLNFYWPSTSVEVFIPSFVKIKYIGSKETGKQITSEIINYLETEENNQIMLFRDKVANEINFWIKKKEKVDEEFNRLLNLDELSKNDSRRDVYMSELLIKQNDFQLEIDELNKGSYENNLSYEVSTGAIKKFNLYIQVLLGLISGLIFSFLILIFKSIKLN
jgi:hypothetical protein